jgi:hypothetical protein
MLLPLEYKKKKKHNQELQLLDNKVLLTTNALLGLSITTLVKLIPWSIACTYFSQVGISKAT